MDLIVVPLDGSTFAEEALPMAAELAARRDGRLALVTVHRPLVPYPDGETTLEAGAELDGEIREDEEAYLAREGERVTAAFGVPVTAVVLDGLVDDALADYVASHDADLVVLSSHGRGGVSRFFLGSVADRLIRGLQCPILLIRPGRGPITFRRAEAAHIAVPLDRSPRAETAVRRALSLLRPGEAVIELMTVVPPGTAPVVAAPPSVPGPRRPSLTEDLLLANKYIAGIAQRLRKAGYRVHTEVLVAANVAQAILRFAEERRCDLIALATRGVGGVERAVLGSVADKVIRGASTPVLVWNPPVTAAEPAAGAGQRSVRLMPAPFEA